MANGAEAELSEEEKNAADEALAVEQKAANEQREATYRESENARIRAEAELAGMQKAVELLKVQGQGGPAAVTDAQWTELTEKTGQSKEALLANAQIAQQMVDAAKKEFNDKLSVANKEASEAKAEAAKFKGQREAEKIKAQFLASKPALARYSQDIDAFVEKFVPESDRADEKKMKAALADAEIYVRGKVGDKMKKDPAGSVRFERGVETGSEVEGEEGIDAAGYGPHESRFVGFAKTAAERKEDLEKFANTHGRNGVEIDGEAQFAEARRDLFGKK